MKLFSGFLRSLEKYVKKCFGLLVWKKKINFQTSSFDIHFHNILFKMNIILLISCYVIVPVFDLSRSFGNVKSGKNPENVWKRS